MLTEKDVDDWVDREWKDYEEKRAILGFWNIAAILMRCTNANRGIDGLLDKIVAEPLIVEQLNGGEDGPDEEAMKIIDRHIAAQPFYKWHDPRNWEGKEKDFMIVDGEKCVIVEA